MVDKPTKETASETTEAVKEAAVAQKNQSTEVKPAKPWGVWFLYVLVFALGGFTLYCFDNMHKLRTQASNQWSQSVATLSQNQQMLLELDQKTKEAIASVSDEQAKVTQKLAGIKQSSHQQSLADASQKSLWALAEVEYLIRLAIHKISFDKDPKTAATILMTADGVLSRIDEPAFLDLRKKLATKLFAVKSLPSFDREGIMVKLSAISLQVPEFAIVKLQAPGLMQDKPEADTVAETGWEQQLQKSWTSIKAALPVRRVDLKELPLISPKESFYLRQHLLLILEQAQLALMKNDVALFNGHIDRASALLTQYFDQDDAKTTATLEAFADFKSVVIAWEQPELADMVTEIRLLESKWPFDKKQAEKDTKA